MGAVLIGLCEAVLFAEALEFMGIWRFVLYATWALTAIAVARSPAAWKPGLVAVMAIVGLQLAVGYVAVFDAVRQAPLAERAWILESVVTPSMREGALIELAMLVALFSILAARHRPVWTSGPAWSAVAVALTAAPTPLLFGAMSDVGDLWLSSKLAEMQPVAVADDAAPSAYVDSAPRSLAAGRRLLFVSLTDRPWRSYGAAALRGALAAGAACPAALDAAIAGEAPARCVTGLEAAAWCDGLGLRLPTPEEWRAAPPGETPEWTRRDAGDAP